MWYRLDAVDRVCEVSADWDIFAARNGAPGLLRNTVIGRPIWSFLSGNAAEYHYACLFETVRQTGLSQRLRIRFDGPARQTLMQMDIAAGENQSINLSTQTLRERAVHYSPLWDRRLARSGEVVYSCSWCKAIYLEKRWFKLADAELLRRDLRGPTPPEVAYDICPHCEQNIRHDCAEAYVSTPLPTERAA